MHLLRNLWWGTFDLNILSKSFLAFKTISNFHTFILDYAGLLHRDVEYHIKGKDVKLVARGGTPDCKEIVVVMSGYEYNLAVLPQMLSPVIFDLGAHIGSFSLYAINYFKHANPKVFAFEPDKENFVYLQKSLYINNINSDVCVTRNCAIGNYNGWAMLDKSKNNDAYFITDDPKEKSYENCSICTLPAVANSFGVNRIDILKMDIEGGEYAVLGDDLSYEFIANAVCFIALEHHALNNDRNVNWIKKRLNKHFDICLERGNVAFFINRILCRGVCNR